MGLGFMLYKRTFTVLALLAAVAFVPCSAKAENDLQALEGYSQEELLPGFAELLERDAEVYNYFKRTPRAFRIVRMDRSLQQKLVAKTIKPQAVLVQAKPVDTQAEQDLQQMLDRNSHHQPSDHIQIEVTEGDDGTVETTVITTIPVQSKPDVVNITPPADTAARPVMEDINAVPSDAAADVMGWPKYLKVPAGCPKVRSDIEYVHQATTFRRQDIGTPLVRNFIGHGQVMLTDNQVMAFPVIAPNAVGSSFQLTQANDGAYAGQGTAYRVAYSYCPGDLTGFTPEGETPLAAGCVDTQAGSHNAYIADKSAAERSDGGVLSRSGCFLEPNKRYFVSIVPKDGDTCTLAVDRILNMERATDSAKNHVRGFMRNVKGKDVAMCSQLFTGSVSTTIPAAPYAGPCLSKAPYPINYDAYSCGQGVQVPACEAVYARGENFQLNCYDTTGVFPPVEFAHACAENRGSWVKGYRAAVSPTHSCEKMPVTANNAVCAKHNEGKVRNYVCRRDDRNGVDANYVIDGKGRREKCVFDAAHRRYEWVKISGDSYNGTAGVEACGFEGPLEQ